MEKPCLIHVRYLTMLYTLDDMEGGPALALNISASCLQLQSACEHKNIKL